MGQVPELRKTVVEIEGRLHEEYVVVDGEDLPAWPEDRVLSRVGQPLPRVDARAKVTGTARFTHDIQLPGMLHARILRSPHPHARLRRIDVSGALAVPGVLAVLTHENVPELGWPGRPLFDTVLRYQGAEVAAVVAVDEAAATDALDKISVEYEPLPFVVDLEAAVEPDAPRVYPEGNVSADEASVYVRGDTDQGFAEADVVVEANFRTAAQLHNCFETHGSVCSWDGGRLTVWDSTQHVFGVRKTLAQAFGLPMHDVRVIKQFMGGGFGSKGGTGRYTVIAALLARQTGRPVKLLLDRREENLATGHRHNTLQYIKLGARSDGTLTAIYHQVFAGVGAWGWVAPVGGPARELYRCPNVKTEEYAVCLNLGPDSAFRAPGYVEGTVALEGAMDDLAVALGMDPIELRLRNYADTNQPRNLPYSGKGLREAYRIGAELMGWHLRETTGYLPRKRTILATLGGGGNHSPEGEQPPAGPGGVEDLVCWPGTQPEDLPPHRRRGLGMASQIWGGGGGPPAHAEVRVNPDATVTVATGTQDIGTGTRTVLAQVAAEELSIPVEHVRVLLGDTEAGPYGPISAGSLTVASVGPAVRAAAADARRQLVELAASLLDAKVEELILKDGRVEVAGSPERGIALRELTARLGNFMVTGHGSRGPNPEDVAVHTFGAQFAEVEVDLETGAVEVTRIVAVHDSGRIINPLTTSSQVEGGVIQGLGFALSEERAVDPQTGRVLSADLENYRIPTALDVPIIDHVMVPGADLAANNLGAKGVGEPPIIPTAAAVANAVYDALGIRPTDLPLTRPRVLAAIKRLEEAAQAVEAGAESGKEQAGEGGTR